MQSTALVKATENYKHLPPDTGISPALQSWIEPQETHR